MAAHPRRDVSFILQMVRRFLLGREWTKNQLRLKADMATRSPPHPMLPDGPAHTLSNNSYVYRDRRRLVTPPKVVVDAIHDGKKIEGKVGQSLMAAAIDAGVEIEAACDGNLACSTCHVYIDEEYLSKLPQATDEEEDMLDLALFVKNNSRLSCQIILAPELDGIKFKRPQATRNFYVDRSDNAKES